MIKVSCVTWWHKYLSGLHNEHQLNIIYINYEISTVVQQYLTEEILYDFMLEARTKKLIKNVYCDRGLHHPSNLVVYRTIGVITL